MNPVRSRRLPLGGYLLLLAGLFAMHGLQATPSPSPLAAAVHAAVAEPVGHDATPSVALAAHLSGDHQGFPHGDHPGGMICLAMLLLAGLVFGAAAMLGRTRPAIAALTCGSVRTVRRTPRAPPPVFIRLCVQRV
ncbi:MAG: hypothetical protein GEV11_00800 [Streptosporangiales bacterium]|nr:hypothetical protein [Streptosporangiales bacterium]